MQIPEIQTIKPMGLKPNEQALKEAAIKLEATFLSEMLTAAGMGKSRSEFGGGAGEDQFASLLVRKQAESIAQAGGIGLAEMLFKSMSEATNDS